MINWILEVLFISIIVIVQFFNWLFGIITAIAYIGFSILEEYPVIIILALIGTALWMLQ